MLSTLTPADTLVEPLLDEPIHPQTVRADLTIELAMLKTMPRNGRITRRIVELHRLIGDWAHVLLDCFPKAHEIDDCVADDDEWYRHSEVQSLLLAGRVDQAVDLILKERATHDALSCVECEICGPLTGHTSWCPLRYWR